MKEQEIEKLIAPELESLGFECVMLEVVGGARSPVLRVYVDGPDGVTVGDCSMISRTLSALLEQEDPFPGRYLLEVSSPGNNRPLAKEEHFQRFAGSEAKVSAERAGEGRVTYTGRIHSCADGVLVLDTSDGEVRLALDEVKRAHLVNQEYKIDRKREKNRRSRTTRGAEVKE